MARVVRYHKGPNKLDGPRNTNKVPVDGLSRDFNKRWDKAQREWDEADRKNE